MTNEEQTRPGRSANVGELTGKITKRIYDRDKKIITLVVEVAAPEG